MAKHSRGIAAVKILDVAILLAAAAYVFQTQFLNVGMAFALGVMLLGALVALSKFLGEKTGLIFGTGLVFSGAFYFTNSAALTDIPFAAIFLLFVIPAAIVGLVA